MAAVLGSNLSFDRRFKYFSGCFQSYILNIPIPRQVINYQSMSARYMSKLSGENDSKMFFCQSQKNLV